MIGCSLPKCHRKIVKAYNDKLTKLNVFEFSDKNGYIYKKYFILIIDQKRSYEIGINHFTYKKKEFFLITILYIFLMNLL